jgi:hypothetical protein
MDAKHLSPTLLCCCCCCCCCNTARRLEEIACQFSFTYYELLGQATPDALDKLAYLYLDHSVSCSYTCCALPHSVLCRNFEYNFTNSLHSTSWLTSTWTTR